MVALVYTELDLLNRDYIQWCTHSSSTISTRQVNQAGVWTSLSSLKWQSVSTKNEGQADLNPDSGSNHSLTSSFYYSRTLSNKSVLEANLWGVIREFLRISRNHLLLMCWLKRRWDTKRLCSGWNLTQRAQSLSQIARTNTRYKQEKKNKIENFVSDIDLCCHLLHCDSLDKGFSIANRDWFLFVRFFLRK